MGYEVLYPQVKTEPSKPIPTIIGKPWIAHHLESRWLTISEIKRCASFPDGFKFITLNDAWRRIGNSVPPNLIKHITLYAKKLLNTNELNEVIP